MNKQQDVKFSQIHLMATAFNALQSAPAALDEVGRRSILTDQVMSAVSDHDPDNPNRVSSSSDEEGELALALKDYSGAAKIEQPFSTAELGGPEFAAARNIAKRVLADDPVEKAYRVHFYAVVRVPVYVAGAPTQLDAIAKAEKLSDLHRDFKRGEYAEEVVGALVDEIGDDGFHNTRNYVPATGSQVDDWVLDAQRTEAERHASASDARQFFTELENSVETLVGIADQYGSRTFADLMLLQNCILSGRAIGQLGDESRLPDVLKQLPSSERWLKFVSAQQSDSKSLVSSPQP